MMRSRRNQPEKIEQAHCCRLIRSVGGKFYTVGTRRRRDDYQGTMQTPGLPDLIAFLPAAKYGPATLLFFEVKAPGGRASSAQLEFACDCVNSSTPYLRGGVLELTAWLIRRGYLKAENVPHYRRPEGSDEAPRLS